MKIDKEFKKTLQFDPEKANDAFVEACEIFREKKLTVGEIMIVAGNLLYTLGASIEGHQDKGPNYNDLQEQHKKEPSPGKAFMLTGLDVASWFSEYEREATKNLDKNRSSKEEKSGTKVRN